MEKKPISKKTIIIIVISLLIFCLSVLVAGFLIADKQGVFDKFISTEDEHEDIHYHAAFQIYVDGELQDYSGDEFMNFSTCSLNNEEDHDHTDPKGRIHLHENFGDVVHVHAEEVKWRELFESLEIEEILDKELVNIYEDGQESDQILDKTVDEYSWVVLNFGQEINEEKVFENEIDRDYIDEAEKAIESCGL